MFCPGCGKPIQSSASFCQSCGAPIPSFNDAPAAVPKPPGAKKSSAAKFVVIGCVVLIVLAAGVAAAIFFGIKYAFKSSEAAKAAVLALKQSNNARAALGDITDIGTPMGSISSEAGGSGSASLSASVTGTKASGRYYATLIRKNGQWFLASGRIQLEDGRSVNLEGSGAARSLDVPSAAGRQFRNGFVNTASWKEFEWPQQHLHLRLPPDWIQKKMTQRELELRAGEVYSSTYLISNAWAWEREMPADNLLAADAQAASESLKNDVIAGYAVREVGGVTGLLTISDVGGRRVATWKALVPADGTHKSIDISLGAQSTEFERIEPTFVEILDSIRFN